MPFNHEAYNQQFLTNPDQNNAAKYGVSITPTRPQFGQSFWRCIGIHHLTGSENAGNHHVYCDVLDEHGKRVSGARLMVINSGKAPFAVLIDKPLNEAGANIPMYWQDTLSIYLGGDIPSDQAQGFHIRHADEEPGTTRGHHSFYVVWQRQVVTVPDPGPDPEPEPEPQPGDWLTHFDDRQRKQIEFSRLYAREFSHGATGHNDMLIIAKMAELLDGAK